MCCNLVFSNYRYANHKIKIEFEMSFRLGQYD